MTSVEFYREQLNYELPSHHTATRSPLKIY